MPLVLVHKASRGKRPHSPEQRRSWAIAAQTEPAFKRAFSRLLSSLITDEDAATLREALSAPGATAESVMSKLSFFDPNDKDSVAKWERFVSSLDTAYRTGLTFAADAELKRQGWKSKVVQKATAKLPFIPVDRKALDWMKRQSLAQAAELSKTEKERLRTVLTRAMEAGQHPSATVEDIRRTVGLTSNQVDRVWNRRDAMLEEGFTQRDADAGAREFAEQLRDQRAEAIARTEALAAQTEGLKQSWRAAEEAGLMPEGTMKRWVATNDERTSEICLELHDQLVPIDEDFDSEFVGPIEGPPAHPNCRSTMVLEFPQE